MLTYLSPAPPNLTATELAILNHVGGWTEFCDQYHFDLSKQEDLDEALLTLREVAHDLELDMKAQEEWKNKVKEIETEMAKAKENCKQVTENAQEGKQNGEDEAAKRPDSGFFGRKF